ncbi:tyrosine-type recombinase/integrase [Benzoatithermus flavus]|uniref:Tyrosine-type recombinase/integrase n=1 Tax=Benzoatithermus flavus TaxID=3108223 RepID=A0ABU8XMK9_9PROT
MNLIRAECGRVPFACATAMLLSEIASLEWSGLDAGSRTIPIRDRKHPRQKQGNHQAVPLLRGHFAVGGEVIDPLAIIEWQARRGFRIFPSRPDSISTAFMRAVAACGSEDLPSHDLRHHGCSLLFEAGYGIEEVSLVSGHRDWNMLRRYPRIEPEPLHRRRAGQTNVVDAVDRLPEARGRIRAALTPQAFLGIEFES